MVDVDLLIAYHDHTWSKTTVGLPNEATSIGDTLLELAAIDVYKAQCGSLKHIAHMVMLGYRRVEVADTEEEQA